MFARMCWRRDLLAASASVSRDALLCLHACKGVCWHKQGHAAVRVSTCQLWGSIAASAKPHSAGREAAALCCSAHHRGGRPLLGMGARLMTVVRSIIVEHAHSSASSSRASSNPYGHDGHCSSHVRGRVHERALCTRCCAQPAQEVADKLFRASEHGNQRDRLPARCSEQQSTIGVHALWSTRLSPHHTHTCSYFTRRAEAHTRR